MIRARRIGSISGSWSLLENVKVYTRKIEPSNESFKSEPVWLVSDCSVSCDYVPRRGSQASHTSHRLKRQARRLDVPGKLSLLANLSSLPTHHLHHSPALPQPLSSHHASLFSSHAWDTRPFIDCLLPASHNPFSTVFKHHRLPPRVSSCLLLTHKHRVAISVTEYNDNQELDRN